MLNVFFLIFGGLCLLGLYALLVVPFRLKLTRYTQHLDAWSGPSMRVALIADPHSCRPWMGPKRLARIVKRTMAAKPDLILLLGDYNAPHPFQIGFVQPQDWAREFAVLQAPLGVHAILGNHDWWDDSEAFVRRAGPVAGATALREVGIKVYQNNAVELEHEGQKFWMAGLDAQHAFYDLPKRKGSFVGAHDVAKTLENVAPNAPLILMAHEPDIFPDLPDQVDLTVSGHTHGGQITFFGYAPVVPSKYGQRYAYGHHTHARAGGGARHLITSGGLGCSGLPLRLGVAPEIVIVEVS